MQDKVVSSGSNSIAISVEALAPESYSDLIKVRRPGSKFQPAAGKERAIAVSYKDLIVVTRFHGRPFGPVASVIDERLAGAIEQSVDNSAFQSRQGETLVVELESRGLGSGNARKILVIGLGDPAAYGQFVYCGLIGKVIEESVNLGSEQLILLLGDLNCQPNRLSEQNFAAILSCRVAHHCATQIEHGRLRKIRLVVEPEKKEAVEASLTLRAPLCRICEDPAI